MGVCRLLPHEDLAMRPETAQVSEEEACAQIRVEAVIKAVLR
jgi:hypothetical protein